MNGPPTLLLLTPSSGGYYFGALLTGIARELAAVGGRAVVVQTQEPGGRSDEGGVAPDFRTPVAWDQVSGAISITSAVRADYLTRLQATGRPVVLASNRLDGLVAPSALPDNRGGVTAAVDHLVGHGHVRIGFVGNLAQRDIQDRHEAYVTTLEAHGLTALAQDAFLAPDNGEPGGRVAAAAWLRAGERPTALLVATDRNAIGLIDALRSGGVDVPGDVAVASFDNIEASSFSRPPLTTVDQPFDEVGGLAARLLLAEVAGGQQRPGEHRARSSVIVRGSCGCGGSDGPTGSSAGIRAQTGRRIRSVLIAGPADRDAAVPGAVNALLDRVDTLLTDPIATGPGNGPAVPSEAELDTLTALLRRSVPRAELMRTVARVLDEYVRATATGPRATSVLACLRDVQAAAFLRQSVVVETMLDEQFGIDTGLLDSWAGDPRSLGWLAGTHVRSAVLATWDEVGRTLTVAGVHDPDGAVAEAPGTTVRVEEFPTRSLIDMARPEDRLLCYVVPVRSREHEWGLLAVVAEIEITSARETYHHWATLLASALDQQALQDAVHASEERYALVARAANDGLWEIDLTAQTVYVSDRCRDLLAMEPEDDLTFTTWERLIHPADVDALRAAITRALEVPGTPSEVEYRVADGTDWRWVLSRALGVQGADATTQRLVGSLSDIGDRRQLEERLRLAALYDEITGLPNRRLFLDRLGQAVEQQRRRGDRFAVVFLDLDGFKLVNDSLGHLVGDQLLTVVAERLSSELRSVDTAARFGGDEFAVLLSDPIPDEVLVIARRIQERIAEPVTLAGHEVSVTASVGIATSESGYSDAEDVLRDADIAMYDAKGTDRGSASVFDQQMHARASGRLQARAELRAALAEHQFVVHYQPIVALDGAHVSHFEALVRWEHPDRGLLLPGAFLPAMEDNATIVALGRWVLDEVCRQIAAWDREQSVGATVSVNLSHQEFWAPDLVQSVSRALANHGVPAARLVLEITETVIMKDQGAAREIMHALHALGTGLHIDDFGTGQSSLHALRSFPVDALKIDGSFIRELGGVAQTTELVRIIVEIGAVLGLDVVAECVETADQAHRLQAMGCANAQGWLYARALPGEEAGALLGQVLLGQPIGVGS